MEQLERLNNIKKMLENFESKIRLGIMTEDEKRFEYEKILEQIYDLENEVFPEVRRLRESPEMRNMREAAETFFGGWQ